MSSVRCVVQSKTRLTACRLSSHSTLCGGSRRTCRMTSPWRKQYGARYVMEWKAAGNPPHALEALFSPTFLICFIGGRPTYLSRVAGGRCPAAPQQFGGRLDLQVVSYLRRRPYTEPFSHPLLPCLSTVVVLHAFARTSALSDFVTESMASLSANIKQGSVSRTKPELFSSCTLAASHCGSKIAKLMQSRLV